MTGERPGPGLIVVTGPPRAGKSAVSRVLADRCGPSALVRGDDGFRDAAAARHMHAHFATAAVDQRHVLVPPGDPAAVARQTIRRVADGAVGYAA